MKPVASKQLAGGKRSASTGTIITKIHPGGMAESTIKYRHETNPQPTLFRVFSAALCASASSAFNNCPPTIRRLAKRSRASLILKKSGLTFYKTKPNLALEPE